MLSTALRLAVKDPAALAWAASGRFAPRLLYERQERAAARMGFDRLWMILSFDCDTPDDIAVAWEVHARLLDMGVLAHYAVPGALLREGADVYRRIAATGAEFINHGGRNHTYFDEEAGVYRSCFFYDRQTREDVLADIRQGHEAVLEVIGKAPRGFRTPHFGTFRRPEEIAFLHGVLRGYGYAYSSSTLPVYGFHRGPAVALDELIELPVSARHGQPLQIFDSWNYYRAPGRILSEEDYLRDADRLADAMKGRVGLVNLYADPCHVAGEETFFEAIRLLRAVAEPTSFSDLSDRLAAARSGKAA